MTVFTLYMRRLVRRPLTLAISLVLPIVMAAGVVVQYRQATTFTVAVVVADPAIRSFVETELTTEGVSWIESGSQAQVTLTVPGTIDQAVGHADALQPVISYSSVSANNVLLATRLNSLVSVVASVAARATSASGMRSDLEALTATTGPVGISTSVLGNPNATVLTSSYNMIVFIILLLTLSNALMFIKDKKSTTSMRILVASRSKMSYYLQLIGVFTVLGLVDFGVIWAVMRFGFGVATPLSLTNAALLVAGFGLFTVVAIALGLLLVSRAKSETSGKLLVTSVGLPLAMLGGCLWPASIMPHWMRVGAQALPTTWLTQLNGAVFNGLGASVTDRVVPLALLAGLAAVMVALLSRVPSESI